MKDSATMQIKPQRPIPILMYHQIDAPAPRGAPFRALSVSPQAFATQMRWLKRMGFTGLSMGDLEPYLRGEKTGQVVGITFDDGYQNNLHHALPVLQAHGFSSTCYAISQKLGASNDWDAHYGVASKSLMNAAELRQWAAAGHEVGSHTRHHVRLPECTPALAEQEIAQSRQELEEAVGQAVRHFCYPYGQFNAEHVRMAQAAGYTTTTTVNRGRVRTGDDAHQLPRVPVWRATHVPSFLLKVLSAYEDKRRG